MGLRPLGDRVLIKPAVNPDQTESGLHLPENRSDKYVEMQGTVVYVGSPKCPHCQKGVHSSVKAGDDVLFSWSVGQKVTIDDDEYLLMRESDLLAVIESEPASL